MSRPTTKGTSTMPDDTTEDQRRLQVEHLCDHLLQRPGDCALARDLRSLLNDALTLAMAYRDEREQARAALERLQSVEIVGGEFVDAAEMYRALGLPMPKTPPVDHAARIRERFGVEQPGQDADPDGAGGH